MNNEKMVLCKTRYVESDMTSNQIKLKNYAKKHSMEGGGALWGEHECLLLSKQMRPTDTYEMHRYCLDSAA